LGSGTDLDSMARRGFGLLSPNRPLHGANSNFRATAGPDGTKIASSIAAALTIATSPRPKA
jgi:hypothetical protein